MTTAPFATTPIATTPTATAPSATTPTVRRIEFLMCGSPNDAFYSQAAMFRLSLDALGGIHRSARLVLCLADHEETPLPARWQPYFRDIEVRWASLANFLEHGDGTVDVYAMLSADADCSVICDADTLLVNPLDDDFLAGIKRQQAIAAVVAHFPPLLRDRAGHDYSGQTPQDFWDGLSQHVLGRPITLGDRYTMTAQPLACPFYINYGFVIGPSAQLVRMNDELGFVQPKIREYLDNVFYAQIGVALAVERARIPYVTLPMRYNFPNDAVASALYPEELANVRLIHYLRTMYFDRHRIFATRAGFDEFMALPPLGGCNSVLQARVRELTGGTYPFA